MLAGEEQKEGPRGGNLPPPSSGLMSPIARRLKSPRAQSQCQHQREKEEEEEEEGEEEGEGEGEGVAESGDRRVAGGMKTNIIIVVTVMITKAQSSPWPRPSKCAVSPLSSHCPASSSGPCSPTSCATPL